MSTNLPPGLEMLSRLVDCQPPQVWEIIHCAIVQLLLENGKAEIIETKGIDDLEHLFIRTWAGELFSVVKLLVSEELLERLKVMAREVIEGDAPGSDAL